MDGRAQIENSSSDNKIHSKFQQTEKSDRTSRDESFIGRRHTQLATRVLNECQEMTIRHSEEKT